MFENISHSVPSSDTVQLHPELVRRLNLPTGNAVGVADVARDGPAHHAGILPGDLIVRMDGASADTMDLLRRLLAHRKEGERVRLDILRGDQQHTVVLVLGAS